MNKPIKVLLISYYWPPAGGGGVQRWLKFSKYLSEMNVELTVYTPENGEHPVIDESLVKEVSPKIKIITSPIWEPYQLFKLFTGKKKKEKVYSGFISEGKSNSMTQKLSVFIRGNFFIPDARKFWIKPSIKFLDKYVTENPVDLVISTGPPHSMHLIALGVKKKFNLPWIADFRDPWTKIDFYDQLMLSSFADASHKRKELSVLKNADKVVTVSPSWAQDFESIYKRDVQVIYNGFDPEDFKNTVPFDYSSFCITHTGSMNADRNPKVLWQALQQLCNENEKLKSALKIKLIGSVDFSIIQSIKEYGLEQNLEKVDFIPHSQIAKELCSSALLLLPINRTPNMAGVLPGKLYEYMGAKRPILCVGPKEGDAFQILSSTNSGYFADYDNVEVCKNLLQNTFEKFQSKTLEADSEGINKFSRKTLAEEYFELMKKLV